MRFSATDGADPQFWRQLCPLLSIEGREDVPSARLPAPLRWVELLRTEGYLNEADVFPRAYVENLREGVRRVREAGFPPAFIFTYDEPWLLFRSLAPFLAELLGTGYRQLPAFWAWYVEPSDAAAGWRPHRDRPMSTYSSDNTPDSLTLWVPLTDATALNGCMYVLPADRDASFQHRSWKGQSGIFFDGEHIQNIRALPATAGSLLGWNHALVHWGGRASARATGPRCSIALEFQRGDRAPYEGPLADPSVLMPLTARLGLISHLTRQYSPWHKFNSPEIQAFAAELEARFYPA